MSEKRIFRPYSATADDLEKFGQLATKACPRRYCFWWQSLAFDWEHAASQGCRFSELEKPPGWLNTEIACCRADPNSKIDHFERRESSLLDDGGDTGSVGLATVTARAATLQ